MVDNLADYWRAGAIDELDWYARAVTFGEIEDLRAAFLAELGPACQVNSFDDLAPPSP